MDYTPKLKEIYEGATPEDKNIGIGNCKKVISCDKNAKITMKVEVEVPEGSNLSYQWYALEKKSGADKTTIEGATSNSYTVPTSYRTSIIYYCQVINSVKDTTYKVDSEECLVDVKPTYASPAVISTQPEKVEFLRGQTSQKIQINAVSYDLGSTLTYQWYLSKDNSNENGTAVENGNKSSVIINTDEAGTYYYYCKIKNSLEKEDGSISVSEEIVSNPIEVIIHDTSSYFQGKGTKAEPFLIKQVEDFSKIRELVAKGNSFADTYFKVVNESKNLTLPNDWEMIGTLKSGFNDTALGVGVFSSKKIVLDVAASDSKGADNIQLELPKDMVNSIVKETEATVTVKSEQGEMTIDRETLAQISKDAKGTAITVIISKMKTATEEQKKLTGENTTVYKLTVKSGNEVISQFNGKVTVKLPIPAVLLDKAVAAVHFDSADKFTVMDGKRVTEAKKDYYVFDTTHFSEFGLVDAKEAGVAVDDNVDKVDKVKEAKKITSKMKLTTVATKTKKKTVKVNVKMTKKTKTDIKALKKLGYSVKYSFYRSTKKNGSYKVAATKKANTYTYVKGKKAKRYYYKTQVRVYDKKGKLITKTTLKNSKYASKAWAK